MLVPQATVRVQRGYSGGPFRHVTPSKDKTDDGDLRVDLRHNGRERTWRLAFPNGTREDLDGHSNRAKGVG